MDDPTRTGSLPDQKLDSYLPVRLSDLGVLLNRHWTAVLAPYGIVPMEFRLLSVLVQRGTGTAVEIAAVLPTDASFISRMVQRLAEKQMLARRRSSSDRRIVTLRPTEAGHELVRRLARRVQDMERDLVRGIPADELSRAGEAISAMIKNLEETKESL